MTAAYDWLPQALATIHRADWHRSVTPIDGPPGPVVSLDGHPVINFASNDYLGLAGDRRLQQAAIAAIQTYGTGSTGSRLVSGHRALHRQLEQAIAHLKQTDDALVFSSGYLANLGTVSALVGKRDVIVADQYNHSSLKKGALLTGAQIWEYPHGDMGQLQTWLEQHRAEYRRCLILTDSVFSMDGDVCPLPQLIDLAQQFSAMLLVDEAHATGVFGRSGAGCVEHFGCTGHELIQVGTLSKALGSLGGYVAGSAALIDFLRNRSSGWIYTTGLSPADTAAALAAIDLVHQEPARREQLWQRTIQLQRGLQSWCAGLSAALLPSDSPILCLQVESPAMAVNVGLELKKMGLFVPAIRPPTVPTSRLRMSVMATHTSTHIECLLASLDEILGGK